MEAVRQSWTDDRLDDFRAETGRRFDEVDRRFDDVDKRFEDVDKRFVEVGKRFDRVETEIKDLGRDLHLRFDALQRTMLQFSGVLLVAVIGFMISQAWFLLTQI
jgi:hypothetical protein